MIKVKLCGLTRLCDIAWTNEAQPDYAGFVFAGTRRRVSDETARTLRQHLDTAIPAVGVFVDEPIDHIVSLVRAGTIQMVQLHGHEDETYIRSLRQVAAVPVIQAFAIRREDDMQRARDSTADYILLDQGAGGTGQRFDWRHTRHIDRPFFLAGGLDAAHIAEAMSFQPFALDVSSGIETDGFKDRHKIMEFMAQVRAVQEEKI
jgi:phosphoribosylanthranilate isomerase